MKIDHFYIRLSFSSSVPRRLRSPHLRSYQNEKEMSSSMNLKNHLCRPDDDPMNSSLFSSKCLVDENSSISSSYIRRTPFARRSLPHTNHSILKKSSYSKSASSPDPFAKRKEKVTRHLVMMDPVVSVINPTLKSTIGKYFSDLSLNQIENDSLAAPSSSTDNRLPMSSSSTTPSTRTSSSNDDSSTTNPFIHIQMTNFIGERKSIVYPSKTISNPHSNNATGKSTSFIHNVSITV